MLSGLEKFSLDSGDAKNDENQEKWDYKNVFFLRKHALQRLIEELRPKTQELLFFHYDPPGCTQLFRYQGGRSCTGARVAPAEKFGLGRKF